MNNKAYKKLTPKEKAALKAETLKASREKVTQETLDSILAARKNKTMPKWFKSWSDMGLHRNHEGTPYKGINQFTLMLFGSTYTSPYWLSYRQAVQILKAKPKGSIKGKGVHIYHYVDKKFKGEVIGTKDGEEITEDRVIKVLALAGTVFNASLFEGLPSHYYNTPDKKAATKERLEDLDTVFNTYCKKTKVQLLESGSGAFYRPSNDSVNMPSFDSFKDNVSYYSVLAHEVAHSTMTKERCNRSGNNKFGSPKYAFEELVAELSSMFFMIESGHQAAPKDDNIAYLDNWLNLLKDHKDAIFKACSLANQAVNFIQDKGQMNLNIEKESAAA